MPPAASSPGTVLSQEIGEFRAEFASLCRHRAFAEGVRALVFVANLCELNT
jgi:hypothetical protein